MKLVIIDRDGVINKDSDAYIKAPEEWIPIPGSLQAISQLTKANFKIAVATNQSGVGRGYYDEEMLNQIHQKMLKQITEAGGKVDKIVYCPHHPNEQCNCRKPKPGLLQQIAEYYKISLTKIPYIGDSIRDVQAALNAGAQPILVLTGNGKQAKEQLDNSKNIPIFPNLAEAAQSIIKNYKG